MRPAFAAVRRSHKIVELLAGRCFDGLTNKELAKALSTTPTNISRDLQALADLGYVQQLEVGRRWTLTARPLAVMHAYAQHLNAMQDRMASTTRNIEAGAKRLA